MRKLITGMVLVAGVQAAAAADPAALYEPAHEHAGRALAEAFDGAGLHAVRLGGRPLLAEGLMLAQTQPPGTIGTPRPRPSPSQTTTTTTSQTTTAETPPPAPRKWYYATGPRIAVIVLGVLAVGALIAAASDDDEPPAPAGTGASN